MSPNRRQILAAMAGGALSLAVTTEPAGATVDSLTEHEALIAARDTIKRIRNNHDIYDPVWEVADSAILFVNRAIIKLCPHDPAEHNITPQRDLGWHRTEHVHCPSCRATTTRVVSWPACELCGDTGSLRHPFTGEYDPCPACG